MQCEINRNLSGISTRRSPSSIVSRLNRNLKMLAFWEEGKPKNTAKNPQSRKGNRRKKTQSTYGVNSGIGIRDTAMRKIKVVVVVVVVVVVGR